MCSPAWPSQMVAPISSRLSVIDERLESLPVTRKFWPSDKSTLAMPLMPMPPMPTKCMCLTPRNNIIVFESVSRLEAVFDRRCDVDYASGGQRPPLNKEQND